MQPNISRFSDIYIGAAFKKHSKDKLAWQSGIVNYLNGVIEWHGSPSTYDTGIKPSLSVSQSGEGIEGKTKL